MSVVLISVVGPSGVGKSSAIASCTYRKQAYLEVAKNNPYLPKNLEKGNFNAYLNQLWFLDQIDLFLQKKTPYNTLVLDQDPFAIVKVYGKRFFDEGVMSSEEFTELWKRLKRIEKNISQKFDSHYSIFMDARAEILRERVLLRDGALNTPTSKWFESLRQDFLKLRPHYDQSKVIDTSCMRREDLGICLTVGGGVKTAKNGRFDNS